MQLGLNMSTDKDSIRETTVSRAMSDVVFKVFVAILNVCLISIGSWIAVQGILYYIAVMDPGSNLVDWLGISGLGEGSVAFQAFIADNSLSRFFTGGIVCLSGCVMFSRKKWAIGFGMVSCLFLLMSNLPGLISFIGAVPNPLSWAYVLQGVMLCVNIGVSIFGVVWLSVTHKYYR
jgi:hypothetical protein